MDEEEVLYPISVAIPPLLRNLAVDLKVTKFVEAMWRFMFYFFFFIVGYVVLFVPDVAVWISDSKELWKDWPFHPVSPAIQFYYQVELGAYLHQLMWTEVSRSDAVEMMIHHVVTVVLLSFSYLTNFTRIGTYILFVHDSADIFLELGKIFNYVQRVRHAKWAGTVTDGFFAIFTITFFITRLYIYPRYLVFGFVDGAYRHFGVWPGYYFYASLLVTLQFLHIFWFFLILRVLYRLVVTGVVEKDSRSDDDDDVLDSEASERNKHE